MFYFTEDDVYTFNLTSYYYIDNKNSLLYLF